MKIQFGKYLLLDKIGTGGMAEIFLAKEQGLAGFERFVVIKRVLPFYVNDDKFIKMFLDEAKLAAQLNHPNIVHIFDFGKEGESYYIAMEYIAGGDLEKIANKAEKAEKVIPLEYCCEIIAQVAEGLYHAHTLSDMYGNILNIVHRDVSPQNILVNFNGKVKMVDFGIAKAASQSNKTRTGVIKGKLSYMSPEQISGKTLDGRSDVFALGVLLYELTMGVRLFKAESDLRVLKMITEEPITQPIETNPAFPRELNNIIMKALERDRDKRYLNAQDLRVDLQKFLKNQNLEAVDAKLADFMKDIFTTDIEEFQKKIADFESEEVQEESNYAPKKMTAESKSMNNLVTYMGALIEEKGSKAGEDKIQKTMILEENTNNGDIGNIHTVILDDKDDDLKDFLNQKNYKNQEKNEIKNSQKEIRNEFNNIQPQIEYKQNKLFMVLTIILGLFVVSGFLFGYISFGGKNNSGFQIEITELSGQKTLESSKLVPLLKKQIDIEKEQLILIYFDETYKIISHKILKDSLVDKLNDINPKTIFTTSLMNKASFIAIIHYSYDKDVISKDYTDIVKKIYDTGSILNVELFDFIAFNKKNDIINFIENRKIKTNP